MYRDWFQEFRKITPEEQQILNGKTSVQKSLYTSRPDFVVESDKFMENAADDIAVRRHTRFIDFPRHRHDYVEIFYVISGSVTHSVNGEKITIHTGELLFMNQNIEHAIFACGENDLAVNILIRPEYFQNIISLIGQDNILASFMVNALEGESCVGQYLYFSVADNPCIQNLFQNTVFLLINKPRNWHKLSENTFALLFMHILSSAENILLDQSDKRSNVLMLVVRRYIMDHYDTGTLHELAEHIGYTQSSLSRIIKKFSGSTFKEMQAKQRLLIAMNRLYDSDMPIAEIALSVGYENQNFFYKQFKKEYGMTPNEARLKMRE
ncbi:MAG: AraC family transcriptional regulator [Eubacteriales bacterium]|nr:AraC family transcriptional regulator [Eubacteriales bacterium]